MLYHSAHGDDCVTKGWFHNTGQFTLWLCLPSVICPKPWSAWSCLLQIPARDIRAGAGHQEKSALVLLCLAASAQKFLWLFGRKMEKTSICSIEYCICNILCTKFYKTPVVQKKSIVNAYRGKLYIDYCI